MFSRLERERLQAMGLTVYQTVGFEVPSSSSQAVATLRAESEFWQTRLGLNIRHYAEGVDTAALPASVQGAEGKKTVWRMIRALRTGR